MIEQLSEQPVPGWLENLSADVIANGAFPLSDILADSLYYPSSGFDGDPIKYFAGNFFSFIYVDYGYNQDDFENALKKRGFRGYHLIGSRSVSERELTPNGWRPIPPSPTDGDPNHYNWAIQKPFCKWAVFQRGDEFDIRHGPSRFSLLYLCADGVAAYQALYISLKTKPKAVAVIQPGTGFGLNYTNFEDPNKIFAKSVLDENPAGRPEILVFGGHGERTYYERTCWPIYKESVCFLEKAGGGTIGVWR